MINRHPSDCRCCSGPAAVATPEPEPIKLPARPTPIRVHSPGLRPVDCTLHPDGALTAVMGGEVRRNFMNFDDMRERDWKHARIEFNPAPPDEEPEPEPAVQEAIAL